ncbi:MAG: hypothetical protein JWQ81_8500 [Amycolatopsis sp.]|uniref:hypothetical protein n=1 Tax=Amycolatopsis sp. TaxID=37632 RepID=UPI00262714BB|nr:hypothetical protein [Amycolatopsis sp.]MCU1687761.1 hypothetical protein [Amycolatopsis sp.]
MTAPIRPGTAARLGLKPPARPMPTGLINTPRKLTDKQLRELKAAAGVWFAKEGWRHSPVPPVSPDWDARFRFGEHPVPVEVYDPVTGEHLGTVQGDPGIRQPPRPPRRRWWHRRNR